LEWIRGRGIFESPEVTDAITEASKIWPRFNDAYAGLQWLLSREAPNLGVRRVVEGQMYRLYRQAGNDIAKTPDIVVVYTFDDENVHLLDLKVEERGDPQTNSGA
jgi:hypothetical protein